MFLYLGENRRIIASKEEISQEDAMKLEQKKIGVYYAGEFSFFMGENKPGFEKVFYLRMELSVLSMRKSHPKSQNRHNLTVSRRQSTNQTLPFLKLTPKLKIELSTTTQCLWSKTISSKKSPFIQTTLRRKFV